MDSKNVGIYAGIVGALLMFVIRILVREKVKLPAAIANSSDWKMLSMYVNATSLLQSSGVAFLLAGLAGFLAATVSPIGKSMASKLKFMAAMIASMVAVGAAARASQQLPLFGPTVYGDRELKKKIYFDLMAGASVATVALLIMTVADMTKMKLPVIC